MLTRHLRVRSPDSQPRDAAGRALFAAYKLARGDDYRPVAPGSGGARVPTWVHRLAIRSLGAWPGRRMGRKSAKLRGVIANSS